MELFTSGGDAQRHFHDSSDADRPLAWRMRPRTLDDFVGQRRLVAPGRLLRRILEARRPFSLILHGPPGCGKTAFALVAARVFQARTFQLNAVSSGVADLKKVRQEAEDLRRRGVPSILFLDEIHRFNQAQQDVLLPMVEDGLVSLLGASTHNPFFALIPPLASRSTLVRFDPLTEDDLSLLVTRALEDPSRGLGGRGFTLTDEARRHLVGSCGGDARRLLNALELAALTLEGGSRVIDLAVAEESLQRSAPGYDEDEHYDTASAFIKSMRGSDPDAAVFWMAKMLAAGEDPLFIARRIVICAAEDVGLAQPLALVVAQAACQAVREIGLPEGRIPLAEAAIMVACAPKSNAAYLAINRAGEDVASGKPTRVPPHLRDTSYRGAQRLGHGAGYRYPHDFPGHWISQSYMPSPAVYYQPTDQGEEATIAGRIRREGD
jgi:putative ATPase